MKGNYRIRLHFVGGGKMQVAYAAQSARDAAFDALLADLSAGEKKWLTFGGALINRLKLTHVEKFEKNRKRRKDMNEKEFADYMLEWLWTSGEELCRRCAYDPKTRMCQNIGEEERAADKEICFRGLRHYAEGKRYPECEGDFD